MYRLALSLRSQTISGAFSHEHTATKPLPLTITVSMIAFRPLLSFATSSPVSREANLRYKRSLDRISTCVVPTKAQSLNFKLVDTAGTLGLSANRRAKSRRLYKELACRWTLSVLGAKSDRMCLISFPS